MFSRILPAVCALLVWFEVVWSERPPEEQHATAGPHRHSGRHAKKETHSLQVTSLMALVSNKVGNQSQGAEKLGGGEPIEGADHSDEVTNGGQVSKSEHEVKQTPSADSSNHEQEANAGKTAEAANVEKAKVAKSDENPPDVNEQEAKHKEDEDLKEIDEEKMLGMVPGMADWAAALMKVFKAAEGTQCLAIKEDSLKYGCAWTPEDRSNMTVKEKGAPMCSCGVLLLEQCYHPDANDVVYYIEAKDNAKAFEVGKAYLAGMCYTPVWIWVVLGVLAFCLCCGGGWSLRKKGDDSRLAGSTLDPAKARNLGS